MTTISYERYECKLRDGTIVLGKLDTDGGVRPYHYANRSQAEKAAQRENGEVVQRGRPFYVRLSRVIDSK